MTYELSLEQFKGPLEKLLDLIEERKLEVTEISLAKVTDDFIAHTRTLQEVHPTFLADFIVVASHLVLIKSKALVPDFSLSQEEEEDIRDLEDRLRLYRDLKKTEEHIKALWEGTDRAVGRPYFMHLSSFEGIFYPGENVTQESLTEALGRVTQVLERFIAEEETVHETIISLEEKMQEIWERMEETESLTLGTVSHKRSRGEMVALFLAVLHLAREERIALEQRDVFSDIIVKKRTS